MLRDSREVTGPTEDGGGWEVRNSGRSLCNYIPKCNLYICLSYVIHIYTVKMIYFHYQITDIFTEVVGTYVEKMPSVYSLITLKLILKSNNI